MTLTSALNSANSSLYVTGDQSSVVSRNISNAGTPLYTRKSVEVVTIPGSGVKVSQVTRAEEPALFRNLLSANSDASSQKALNDALDQLNTTVNDVQDESSPAALLTKLSDALQSYSAQPQSKLAAEAAVRAARNVSDGLNAAASTVQTVRSDADTGIASSVTRINSLLQRFQSVNQQIVSGTQSGADVTDAMDSRDQILNDLSTEIGIRTSVRDGNDMAIYTDSGAVLFDKSPRTVTFDRTLNLTPGMAGNAVMIDGVPVTGSGATMPVQSGQIVGLTKVRDSVTVDYQRQLDETARSLINMFAESDQTGGGAPDVPGLFTYSGAPTLPNTGLVDGIALGIKVNANVDPDVGGDATRLRDGGISDPSSTTYVYNTTGSASFSDRINELYTKLGSNQTFDPSAKLATSQSLLSFSSASVAWLQEGRKVASDAYNYSNTVYQRASDSYSKLTGVNLDEELSTMLELERSYQTSSKLISTVDSMFNALIQAV